MTKTLSSTLLLLGVTAGLTTATAAAQNLAINGGFEAGDTSSWVSFPTAGSTFVTTSDANSGSFAGVIFNDTPASPAVVKQANLGVGVVMPGATVEISFAAKGEGMVGGVAFAEFFSELAGGGVSGAEILSGAPLGITSSWQTFTFTTTAANNTSGGITLQFAAVTGGAPGSVIELFVDDVVITATNNVIELSPYSEDFESLDMMNAGALGAAGWLGFANVFDPTGSFLYNYGTFPAPNGTPGFSSIVDGQGGVDQGTQQLVTYSDYNNADHGIGNIIETNVFQEQLVGADDVGKTFTFQFDAKLGDLIPNSTASAFIKVIDSVNFALDGFSPIDTTNLPTTWGTYSVSLTIEPQHVGDFFQIGFQTEATNFTPSGIVYDNIVFSEDVSTPGTNYCMATANSTGVAASISASGSNVAANNDLTLAASDLPINQFGFFLVSATQSFVPGLGGASNGNLCLGGTIGRYNQAGQIFSTGSAGGFELPINLNTIPQGNVTAPTNAGQTWNFQAWFRDTVGVESNLTDGLQVDFQ